MEVRTMTKRLVDLDDADVAAAREALGTKTLKDTVTKALKEASASAARRREVERLVGGSMRALADKDERAQVWR
jgi:Arc/MetJ family transcription regulator